MNTTKTTKAEGTAPPNVAPAPGSQPVAGAIRACALPKGTRKPTLARSLEVDLVKVAIIEEGENSTTFAKKCGMSFATLHKHFSQRFLDTPARWKVEAAFGYKRAIWSTSAVLSKRKHSLEVFGFDPYLLTIKELKERAEELHRRNPQFRIEFTGCNTLKDYIERVFEKAAVTFKPVSAAQT